MDGLNGDMLSMILQMLGVRDVKVTTDTPDTKISIGFTRYDQSCKIEYTLSELIQAIEGPKKAPQEALEGFTDLATLPDPSSG